MSIEEWNEMAYRLMGAWPGSFTRDNLASYFDFLRDEDAGEVEAAVRRLAKKGNRFIPSVGEICGEIERVREADIPTFDEMWEPLIMRSLWRKDSVGWLNEQGAHRYVIAWLASYGVQRLKLEHLNDPQYAGAIVQRMRHSYEEFLERATIREKNGHPILTTATRRQLGPQQLGVAMKELGATMVEDGPED